MAQTLPLRTDRTLVLAAQRVDPLTLCGLWGLSWLIWGSEGPSAEGLPWLAQRVLGTEGRLQKVENRVRHFERVFTFTVVKGRASGLCTSMIYWSANRPFHRFSAILVVFGSKKV